MLTSPDIRTGRRGGRDRLVEIFDRQVLQLVADGETYDEAAALLGARRASIDAALRRARRRLGALTDEHAVAIALRRRMIV